MMTKMTTADFGCRPIIEEFWRLWFIGGSDPREGRELGNPQREYWSDPSELHYWISLNEAEARPSYMSVAIYAERNQAVAIDRLYYDFDSKEDLEAAWRDARILTQTLRRRYGAESLIAFSGRKGYHVYAFLERPYRGLHIKEVYGELQAMTLRGLRLQTLDGAVIGDVKRLSRIPYTMHEESGQLCHPVDHRRLPLLVDPNSLWILRNRGIPSEVVEIALSHVEERRAAEEVRRKLPRGKINPKYERRDLRPCLRRVLEEEPEPAHLVRVALVAELRAEGYGPEAIIQLFSRFRDYYRRKTEYQVRDIIRRRIRPFRCSTLQKLGVCLRDPDLCPIYRRRWG